MKSGGIAIDVWWYCGGKLLEEAKGDGGGCSIGSRGMVVEMDGGVVLW